MPGLSASQVTFGEVLEVRGSPMHEDELWAVLYESCDSLKDIFLKGNTMHLQQILFSLNPDNIILCGSGKIKFGANRDDEVLMDKRFIAPERFMTRADEVNDLALEKMFVYTLGMVIYAGVQFGNRSVAELCLSSELETLLLYMCEDDPACRCNLVQVFQACNSRKGIYLSVERIKSMVKSILGNDIPLDDTSPLSDKLSNSSSILKVFSPILDHSRPLPLGSLQPLKPLNSTRMDAIMSGKDERNGMMNRSIDRPSRSATLQRYESGDLDESGESYEPLLKGPEKDRHSKSVSIETRAPVVEETISAIQSNPQESSLRDLPPIHKSTSLPRDKSKPVSTYATSNFKRLMTAEKRKLAKDGFYDENRGKIKVVYDRHKSMPALNSAEQESPRSGKSSARSAEYPSGQQTDRLAGTFRKLTRFASRDSMDSASLATSQYSSAISLNYGSYTLDSQNEGRRPFSYHGNSSNGGSEVNGPGSFERLNEPRGGGPEFIVFPQTPEFSVIDITPARLGPMPRGRRSISVMLPSAQRLDTEIEASAIAKELFDQVTDYLGIKETMYFGLTQIKESEHIFLDLESKLTKYSPSGWKDDKKKRIDFILHFKVKFFVENINYLRHYKTRHLLYLQLRREILCGYIFCPDEAATSLGSLALQAEFGDYIERYHGRCYFEAEHYLPGRVLSRITRSDIYHQLPLLHHSYRGLREDEAEIKFLKEAQRLREYGMLFYQVSRSKKDQTDSVLIGICMKGIVLYEVRGQIKTEIHRQLWHMIKKFSFTRKKFVVEPKKGIGLPTLTLYASSYKKAKYLLRVCQSFHRFSQLSQPRNFPSDSGSMIYSMKSSHSEENADPQKENKAPNIYRMKSSEDAPKISALTRQPQETIPKSLPRNLDVDNKAESDEPPVLPVKSRNSPSIENGGKGEEIKSYPEHVGDEEFWKDYSPKTRRRLSSLKGVPDRMINTVVLKRSPGQGLGITIVGGEDSNRLGSGIFIKCVIAGGLAAKDGRLQRGDRILSVNGTSLDQATHDEAAGILKNATGEVKIVVSQFKSLGTSFLDQTGLSMRDEDLSITPPVSVKGSTEKIKAGKMKGVNTALTLSPIVTDGHADEKAHHLEGNNKKSSKLTREKVVIEDEIDAQQIQVEESQMFIQEDEVLNSTPSVGRKPTSVNGEDEKVEDHEDIIEVIIRKRGNSFGMNIVGGIGSPYQCIYVQSVAPNGATDLDGRIHVGDCLLSVNGIDISKLSHDQAVKVLRNAPEESKFLVSRAMPLPDIEIEVNDAKPPVDLSRMSGNESSKSSNVSVKDTFVVKIKKGIGGLGLSLSGGVGSPREFKDRIMVRRLFPGQPAAACGKLRIGDIILSVNGTEVAGYTQQEAINLLRRMKQSVKLLVKRPHPNDIPEELLVETPMESLDPKSVLRNIQTKISEEAVRQMPEPPKIQDYNEVDQLSLDSYSHQKQEIDGEEIIPYPENFVAFETEPTIQETSSPQRISTHEVLVHAQISGPRQKKVHSVTDNLSDKVEDIRQESSVSLPDLAKFPQAVYKQPVDEPGIEEGVMESRLEHEVSLPDLEELPSFSQAQFTNEAYIPDTNSQDHSSHELSLPDLPSAEEMTGLKLPDPTSPDNQNIHDTAYDSQLPSTDQQSETSSITNPDISSEEEGFVLKIPPTKEEDDVASSFGNKGIPLQSKSTNEPTPSKIDKPLDPSESSTVHAPSQNSLRWPQEPDSVYFEVSLEKGNFGLGFILEGGKSTTGGCFIQNVVSDPAKSCGQLQSGDEIVLVDSVNISESEHMDAVELLRRTKGLVRLGIKRKVGNEKSGENLLGYEMITLERSANGRYGLVLGEENGEIIVKDTVEDEPAALTSNLRHGDIVKEINDIPLTGVSLHDANMILLDANPIVQLAIQRKSQASRTSKYAVDETGRKLSGERRTISVDGAKPPLEPGIKASLPITRSESWRSDSSASSSPMKSSVKSSPVLKRLQVTQDGGQGSRMKRSGSMEDKGEIAIVQMEKGDSGLGMSLTSYNDFGDKFGAFIANINPEGIAAKTGKLKSGDKVVSINGENVEQKHHKDVVEILRNITGKVTLEVFRYPIRNNTDYCSSIASSDYRDANDLAEMDFHFTDEANQTGHEALSDKLLSLLPVSNHEGSTEISDGENTIENEAEFEGQTKMNFLVTDNPDFDRTKEGNNLPTRDDHVTENGLIVDSHGGLKIVSEDYMISNQSIHESLKPNGESDDKSSENLRDINIQNSDRDLSWNNSDISDEEHSKISKEDKITGQPSIEKSSISTTIVANKPAFEKMTGVTNIQETSFSSTLEKVTPSSSIVSSILDEISPMNSSDEEESDFDLSSSVIPDLSSFTIEDKVAFEKLHEPKEEIRDSREEVGVKGDRKEGSIEIAVTNRDEKGTEEKTIEDQGRVLPEAIKLDSSNGKIIENQELNFPANDTAVDEGSKIRNDSFLSADNSLNESFADGLSSMEADASDILMALEEFETRKKNEFNDTMKDQIEKEPSHLETSFTVEKVGEGSVGKGEESPMTQSPRVERRPQLGSKIPKFDNKRLGNSTSPTRRSPGKSGIPIFTTEKRPKHDIELVERNSLNLKPNKTHAETDFMDKHDVVNGKNKGVTDTNRFEMKVEFDEDSDNSFETDDDLALSLTRSSFSFGQEELDVKIAHFHTILDSDTIDREFQEIKDIKPTDSCDVARRSVNRDKNRFRSILPFDKTRVCLAGGEETDYINASHLRFEAAGKSFHYIAAQGPLSNTVDDFWRMVWEHKIETIVMVTKDVEGSKIKCHRYWPDLPGLPLKASDRFRIELTHRKESGNHIERHFSLINTKLNKSVNINHLLFHAWPETGLPQQPLPLLMFVKNCTEIHTSGPLLVHCSAGTGRTGLFVLTDLLNKILPTDTKVDVLALVKSLKQQRQSLIQTKDQYIFCYKMAIEVLQEEKHLTY